MSKVYNLYENDVDRTWYDSSNVVYSECDDITDGLKVLRIYFKSGRVYQYADVDVNDYLLFREDSSQGKALSKIIKKYACSRLEDVNVEDIIEQRRILEEGADSTSLNELILQFGDLINEVKRLKKSIKSKAPSEKQLAVIMHDINLISQELVITDFSTDDVNLVNLNEIWVNNEATLQMDGVDKNVDNIIKQRLLENE